MVVPLFEKIENKKLSKTVYEEHPWGPLQLKRLICVVPYRGDMRLLRMRFPTPDIVTDHYKAAVSAISSTREKVIYIGFEKYFSACFVSQKSYRTRRAGKFILRPRKELLERTIDCHRRQHSRIRFFHY